jgi:hypothetical protein
MIDGFKGYQPRVYNRPLSGSGLPRSQMDIDESMISLWGDNALAWGARNGLGEAGDRLMGLSSAIQSSKRHSLLNDMGFEKDNSARALSYGSIFKLSDQHIPWQELSWENYRGQVKANFSDLRDALKPTNRHLFFQGVSLKSYLKEVLWEGNIKPIKDLCRGGEGLKLGSSLAGVAGLGLLGWGIIVSSRQAYQNAKAKEDGTSGSKWNTLAATVGAFVSKSVKSLISWEAAGLGFAFGKALIPIGAFPIGGILVGALVAALVYSQLNKLLPDPPKLD